jgi:hypothetical protein
LRKEESDHPHPNSWLEIDADFVKLQGAASCNQNKPMQPTIFKRFFFSLKFVWSKMEGYGRHEHTALDEARRHFPGRFAGP